MPSNPKAPEVDRKRAGHRRQPAAVTLLVDLLWVIVAGLVAVGAICGAIGVVNFWRS